MNARISRAGLILKNSRGAFLRIPAYQATNNNTHDEAKTYQEIHSSIAAALAGTVADWYAGFLGIVLVVLVVLQKYQRHKNHALCVRRGRKKSPQR
jgi:hypothetical protein